MIAEFYLINHSFRYQEGITKEEIEQKLENLSQDYLYIRKYKNTDKIYVHPSIYQESIFPNLTIEEFLYHPSKWKNIFDRDTRQYLRIIIDRSESTDDELEDVLTVLEEHDEQTIYGLLALHEVEGIDPIYLVYNKNNWLDFHRYFLKLYPIDTAHYYQECIKYFPNLFFHPRIEGTIATIFENFTSKIVFHLTALNDEFNNYKSTPYHRIDTLRRFSIGCRLDQEASNQGNIEDKSNFTFDFTDKEGNTLTVCCEPHLKLCYSDSYPGDSEFYYHRIYFHEGYDSFTEGRILIGHIGQHL